MSDNSSGPTALEIVEKAKAQISELTGHPADGVSASKQTDDGWTLTVEVVELERIPSSTDILGSFQVTLDDDGNVTEYERTHRYYRNRADGHE
jgi:hypothetical protein